MDFKVFWGESLLETKTETSPGHGGCVVYAARCAVLFEQHSIDQVERVSADNVVIWHRAAVSNTAGFGDVRMFHSANVGGMILLEGMPLARFGNKLPTITVAFGPAMQRAA